MFYHSLIVPFLHLLAPKNDSPPLKITAPRSVTTSNTHIRKSPVQQTQTPGKPAVRAITSFFSPVTPSSFSDFQSPVTVNRISESSPAKSSSVDHFSHILTPSNFVNINNTTHQSSDSLKASCSPELSNSSPENKNCGSFLSSSSSVKNKENSSTKISPETVYKTNHIGQTKRRIISKHSTPSIKRKHAESSKKTKGLVKVVCML